MTTEQILDLHLQGMPLPDICTEICKEQDVELEYSTAPELVGFVTGVISGHDPDGKVTCWQGRPPIWINEKGEKIRS